jgi:hypothetical protein
MYLNLNLNLVNDTPDQIENEARIKSLTQFEFFFFPRGPCVGTIAQPPPASQKTTSSSPTNRGVPVLALSTSHRQQGVPALAPSSSHPSSDRSNPSPSSLLDAWWPRVDSIVPWRFAPLELRPLGASPLGASLPWHSAPLGSAPVTRTSPLNKRHDTILAENTENTSELH